MVKPRGKIGSLWLLNQVWGYYPIDIVDATEVFLDSSHKECNWNWNKKLRAITGPPQKVLCRQGLNRDTCSTFLPTNLLGSPFIFQAFDTCCEGEDSSGKGKKGSTASGGKDLTIAAAISSVFTSLAVPRECRYNQPWSTAYRLFKSTLF